MRIHLSSLGCKLNQAEMDALAEQLGRAGHSIASSPAEAEVCILNTCAVTHVAAQKSRQALRRLHRENPQARLIATGCYAELAPGDLLEVPGFLRIVGNAGKDELADRLGGDLGSRLADVGNPPPEPVASSPVASSHTRALVKIQDGCDNACTYCIIHVARGPQRSKTADAVVAQIQEKVLAGYQEIVLTGVHIGAYGRDRGRQGGETDLWRLVSRILHETSLRRLRLSSIEPWDLPHEAFGLWADSRLCRHLHLPLQSGSDATLRRMARRYSAAEFVTLVQAARSAIPGLAITTDVIVGFPGESDEEFAQSLDCVQGIQFARVHVFPFSPRPGTPAATMPHQVPPSTREKRAAAMRAIGAATEQLFHSQFLGCSVGVLWESRRAGKGGLWSGLTDDYLRVYTASPANLRNRLTMTRLTALALDGLRGEIDE